MIRLVIRNLLVLGAAVLSARCGAVTTGLQVRSAWARPADRGMNSAVYLQIQNGPQADALTGAASDSAESIQIHRTILDADGNAKMQQQEIVPLEPRAILVMKPGGYHIMLIDLEHPLVVGDTVDITLVFENAGEYHVSVPVTGD